MHHWQVHAIRVQRKHVVIAMAQDSRYSMVFADLKKGDWQTFLSLFNERLLNNMQDYGEDFGGLTQETFPEMLDTAMSTLGEFRFIQNGERSVQGHLNDVVKRFEDVVVEMGCLPNNREEAAGFDYYANQILRQCHQTNDYQLPFKTMLIQWLRQICRFSPEQIKRTEHNIHTAMMNKFLPH